MSVVVGIPIIAVVNVAAGRRPRRHTAAVVAKETVVPATCVADTTTASPAAAAAAAVAGKIGKVQPEAQPASAMPQRGPFLPGGKETHRRQR
jgi:hypothetical protein